VALDFFVVSTRSPLAPLALAKDSFSVKDARAGKE
jgi:hypothetical protein